MFKTDDVIDHDHTTSLVRIVGDLDWAKSTHAWIKSIGLNCDSPLPAVWETRDRFKVFGYQIKVHAARDSVIQALAVLVK